jgi:hypothetical protein
MPQLPPTPMHRGYGRAGITPAYAKRFGRAGITPAYAKRFGRASITHHCNFASISFAL